MSKQNTIPYHTILYMVKISWRPGVSFPLKSDPGASWSVNSSFGFGSATKQWLTNSSLYKRLQWQGRSLRADAVIIAALMICCMRRRRRRHYYTREHEHFAMYSRCRLVVAVTFFPRLFSMQWRILRGGIVGGRPLLAQIYFFKPRLSRVKACISFCTFAIHDCRADTLSSPFTFFLDPPLFSCISVDEQSEIWRSVKFQSCIFC